MKNNLILGAVTLCFTSIIFFHTLGVNLALDWFNVTDGQKALVRALNTLFIVGAGSFIGELTAVYLDKNEEEL